MSEYGYNSALRAFDGSLRRLGLDYVDLYLLHWPVPSAFDTIVASYRAAEKLLADGRARAIGMSNFGQTHLQTLMERTEVVPAVNQVELHPCLVQQELRATHARLGIVTQAWSPLGGSVRRAAAPSKTGDPLTHPTIVGLAEKHDTTPAQVVLRWHIDHGFSAITKSFRPERIAESFNIFDFALTTDDLAAIDTLDTGERSGPDPAVVHAKTFPIKIEDEAEPGIGLDRPELHGRQSASSSPVLHGPALRPAPPRLEVPIRVQELLEDREQLLSCAARAQAGCRHSLRRGGDGDRRR